MPLKLEVIVLIQPVQPVLVQIKIDDTTYNSQMISLSNTELELSCPDYLEKDSSILFRARYFRGKASIKKISLTNNCFHYILDIENIQFQPGLVINTRL